MKSAFNDLELAPTLPGAPLATCARFSKSGPCLTSVHYPTFNHSRDGLLRWLLPSEATNTSEQPTQLPPLVFFGDSASQQIAEAAGCALERNGRVSREHVDAHIMSFRSTMTNGSLAASVSSLDAFLERTTAACGAGAVVVVCIGLHYAARFGEPGYRSTAVGGRREYERDLTALLRALDAHTRRCPSCASIVLTPPLQHYATSMGDFPGFETRAAVQPCRALPSVLAPESDNSWRAAETRRLAALHSPTVRVLPFDRLTRNAWFASAGSAYLDGGRRAAGGVGSVHAKVNDCTHLCYSRELFEPLWAEIDATAREARGRVASTGDAAPVPGVPPESLSPRQRACQAKRVRACGVVKHLRLMEGPQWEGRSSRMPVSQGCFSPRGTRRAE